MGAWGCCLGRALERTGVQRIRSGRRCSTALIAVSTISGRSSKAPWSAAASRGCCYRACHRGECVSPSRRTHRRGGRRSVTGGTPRDRPRRRGVRSFHGSASLRRSGPGPPDRGSHRRTVGCTPGPAGPRERLPTPCRASSSYCTCRSSVVGASSGWCSYARPAPAKAAWRRREFAHAYCEPRTPRRCRTSNTVTTCTAASVVRNVSMSNP